MPLLFSTLPRRAAAPRAGRLAALASTLAIVAWAAPGAAHAQSLSVGLGGGVDRGRVDCVSSFPCDRSSSHFKLTGAYGFGNAWDAQLVYLHGGDFQGGDPIPGGGEFGGTFRVDGLGLSAGYRFDIAKDWSVVARLGASSMRTRFAYANALLPDVSKTTVQPLAGLGVGYQVTPSVRVGIDYDVTRFKVYTRNGSLRMLGVAAQFSF